MKVQLAKIKDFNGCLINSNLSELHAVGRKYTWTNGHMFSKVDRALVNDELIIRMRPVQVMVIAPVFSDHSPMSIDLELQRDIRKNHRYSTNV